MVALVSDSAHREPHQAAIVCGFVINELAARSLKHVLQQPRPSESCAALSLCDSYGMPSSHAAAMAFALILHLQLSLRRQRLPGPPSPTGAVGGVANTLLPILFGLLHITTALHVDIAPAWSKEDLYHKVFWGGLWGFVFLIRLPLPRVARSWWTRACVYGLVPSLVQLLVIFPLSTPFGVGGVGLGAATPVFVLLFNTLGWSLPAYAWFLLLQSGSNPDESLDADLDPLLGL
ncbi:MAG: hypothetical protein WDW36_009152 [Sanguina aurantia]